MNNRIDKTPTKMTILQLWILVAIWKNRSSKGTEIAETLTKMIQDKKHKHNIDCTLNDFNDRGIVTKRKIKNRNFYSLTDKGRRIVRKNVLGLNKEMEQINVRLEKRKSVA